MNRLLYRLAPILSSVLILSTAGAAMPEAKAQLHRVDMLVQGSSCAACLIRIEKKLKAEKGVLKVVVSIFKPFKAALIYDASRTNWKTINKVLTGEKVTAANFKDSPVPDVPLVLEPR
jgi:copper chaperone CopZ